MKLKGVCPKSSPIGTPDPMQSRYLYVHPSNPALQVPITGDPLVAPVVVGARLIQWKVVDDTLIWTFQTIEVAGSGATPDPTPTPGGPGPWGPVPTHVIAPDANGWVKVDQNSLDNGFYGPLVRLRTAPVVGGGAAPGNGAGNAVTTPENGVGIKLVFEAGPVGAPATFSNEVDN